MHAHHDVSVIAPVVLVSLAVLMAGLSPAVAQTPAPPTLYFSAIPDEDETKLTARFNKVAADREFNLAERC